MKEVSDKLIKEKTGEVKWFDPRKGYGFIIGPDGQDIFAHYTVIGGDGFRVLRDGASVIYDAECSDKGWKATRVVRDETDELNEARISRSRTPRQ